MLNGRFYVHVCGKIACLFAVKIQKLRYGLDFIKVAYHASN